MDGTTPASNLSDWHDLSRSCVVVSRRIKRPYSLECSITQGCRAVEVLLLLVVIDDASIYWFVLGARLAPPLHPRPICSTRFTLTPSLRERRWVWLINTHRSNERDIHLISRVFIYCAFREVISYQTKAPKWAWSLDRPSRRPLAFNHEFY